MAVIQMPGKPNTTGMITNWYKKTGDWVAQGDELFSFDTDEGTFTVKSQKAGRLVAIFVPEGEVVHCPADVGMLASPTPDSVLKMGRMQYLDETQPLSPRPAEPEAPAAAPNEPESPQTEEPAPAAPEELAELPVSEEQLEENIPEETEEILSAEEAPAEEAPAALEFPEEPILEDLPEEAVPETQEEAQPEPMPLTDDDPAQEEAAAPIAEAPAAPAPQPASPVAAPCITCLTAPADLTLSMDIARRTGVTVAAMVRFAAQNTDKAALLDKCPETSLRRMSGMELPNILDLSAYGVTGITRLKDEKPTFLVPAVEDAWRMEEDEPVCYPRLSLSLAFDENTVSLACAAELLRQTCENLQDLLSLLL